MMKKGFTLIELLVVIAVLGILASVVLVAINPAERINEANDTGIKNDVSQVATALESYFTANNGSYKKGANAVTVADLVTDKFLKTNSGKSTIVCEATNFTQCVVVSSTVLAATSNKSKSGGAIASTNGFYVYATFNGKSYVCQDTVASIVAGGPAWVSAAGSNCGAVTT